MLCCSYSSKTLLSLSDPPTTIHIWGIQYEYGKRGLEHDTLPIHVLLSYCILSYTTLQAVLFFEQNFLLFMVFFFFCVFDMNWEGGEDLQTESLIWNLIR